MDGVTFQGGKVHLREKGQSSLPLATLLLGLGSLLRFTVKVPLSGPCQGLHGYYKGSSRGVGVRSDTISVGPFHVHVVEYMGVSENRGP